MVDPIAAWHEEHAHFSRLLGELQRELDAFHAGERPNYELMLDIIAYLREHSDRHHHPREDAAFARLAQRCPDLELPLARLAQEHRVIAHAGETLREQLQAVIDGAMLPREEIEVAAATYLVYYVNHIAREEEHILSRAAEALTPEDWRAVDEAAPASPPGPLA
ncbi:MAG TPA: hemerythrin domain-containing protein [Burkholderiales bacterium]|nr:hemerythrin domain-containing protein [Burkholderiales bacterium]